MPLRYSIHPEARRVTLVGEGGADFAHVAGVMRALVSDPAYRPEYDLLVDARGLAYTASAAEIRDFRLLFDRMRALFRGRIAVVVSGLVRFGMSRMLSQMVEPSGVRMEAFRDLDAARAWLEAEQG